VLLLRAELLSDQARTVALRTTVGRSTTTRRSGSVAEGSNFVEWTITVPEPALWWPHALGAQALHDLALELRSEGEVSHTPRTPHRAAVRRAERPHPHRERRASLPQGLTVGPARLDIAEASPDELRAVVTDARDAGFDLLRFRAHISRPELYEAADELGMLIWQDPPAHRSVRRPPRGAGRPRRRLSGRPPRPPPLDRAVVRPRVGTA